MNNRTKITALLLLITISLAWLEVVAAKGPPIRVTEAIPSEAEQGQQGWSVKIKGNGFDAGSTVRFLVAGTNDDAQIDVPVVLFDAVTGDLDTIINVDDLATVSDYDIEVITRGGRGGKGTGLFKVNQNPTCPGHPSCGDPDGSIQLGSDDDVWPGAGDNSGDDTVLGGDGDDVISGGPGNDDLNGESGDDLLYGEDGDDDLSGGDGYDQLFGGRGKDHLRVDLSGVFMGGVEQGDFADGGTSIGSNGKEDRDYLHLNHLDTVYVVFDTATSDGTYTGTYQKRIKGNRYETVNVEGTFRNIMFIYGAEQGTYIGNDLDNEIWDGGGDDTMIGGDGDDNLGAIGGGDDFADGGSGNDHFQLLYGNDYLIMGPGNDVFSRRDHPGHDVIEDFDDTDDLINIYNSNTCFSDFSISMIDWDQDGFVDDTVVAWGGKQSNPETSITLLDFDSSAVTPDDFNFESDNSNYSGCP
jgi:Ca2+-binding RTX toxin-like protein